MLEEIWDCEPNESFHKIFYEKSRKVIHKVLECYQNKLKNLTFNEEMFTLHELESNEISQICVLRLHMTCLNSVGEFPSDFNGFNFTFISRDYWNTFVIDPDSHNIVDKNDHIFHATFPKSFKHAKVNFKTPECDSYLNPTFHLPSPLKKFKVSSTLSSSIHGDLISNLDANFSSK